MRWQIIFASVSLAVCFGASAPQAGKSDQDAIQGVWRLVAGEYDGKAMTKEKMQQMRKGPGDFELTFKGNIVQPNNGEPATTFKLDPTKKPKHIDLTPIDKDIGQREIKGIYELAGDDFKLCFDAGGKDRPIEFKTREGSNGGGMLIFKRVKQ